MIEFWDKLTGGKKTTQIYNCGAEDLPWNEISNVDCAFTSPPYFNVEKYSDEDTQSYVRYKNIDSWNEDFLHKAIGKMIPTLKKDGILAINIADVYSPKAKDYFDICNPMNDFLSTFHDSEYQGCIGMELAKRPNSGGAGTAKSDDYSEESLKKAKETKDKTFCEPIWIWRKL